MSHAACKRIIHEYLSVSSRLPTNKIASKIRCDGSRCVIRNILMFVFQNIGCYCKMDSALFESPIDEKHPLVVLKVGDDMHAISRLF